jgi:hypothetical protein
MVAGDDIAVLRSKRLIELPEIVEFALCNGIVRGVLGNFLRDFRWHSLVALVNRADRLNQLCTK